jgi:hypothetical protein
VFSGLISGAAKNYKRLFLEEKEQHVEIESKLRLRYDERHPIEITFLGPLTRLP